MPTLSETELPTGWHKHATPLVAEVALATGPAAGKLLARLIQYNDNALQHLTGLATENLLLIQADENALPWVPGIRYFGREEDAPNILIPTHLQSDIATGLLDRAFCNLFDDAPFLLLPETRQLVSLRGLYPLTRATLETWQSLRHRIKP